MRILLSLNKDLFGSKIQYFILELCRTYTNLIMSLVKTYQECVESYTNSLNVISDNILEVCRNLHTFIFHSRQGCIIFDRKIKLIVFKIRFQTTYTTISNTHYFPCQTGHFYPRVINSGIWLLLTYPNFQLRSLWIDSLISKFFFSTKSLPPGLLSQQNQYCGAGKVS